VRFILDNCLPPQFAAGIREFGGYGKDEVIALRERFAADEKDPVWISTLAGERDWIIISGDTAIMTNPANKAAWAESQLTAFFFCHPFMNDQIWKKAHALVWWWPEITKQAKKTPSGHGFQMPKRGSDLKLVFPVVQR
jgi:hypothetical protein